MNEEKINFYGLGPFYYEYQGKKFDGSNWVSKRALYLLMYLLLAKEKNVAAEELVDVFWEESDLNDGKNKPLRYLVWVFIILLFNLVELIHFNLQLWYTLPIL